MRTVAISIILTLHLILVFFITLSHLKKVIVGVNFYIGSICSAKASFSGLSQSSSKVAALKTILRRSEYFRAHFLFQVKHLQIVVFIINNFKLVRQILLHGLHHGRITARCTNTWHWGRLQYHLLALKWHISPP